MHKNKQKHFAPISYLYVPENINLKVGGGMIEKQNIYPCNIQLQFKKHFTRLGLMSIGGKTNTPFLLKP